MKLSEIKELLEQERDWCEEGTQGRLRTDFEEGFIGGLTQAITLLDVCGRERDNK